MIEVIEQEGDVFDLRGSSPTVDVRVIAQITWEDDDLLLSGLHIQGAGPGSAGLASLRQLARELGRLWGARRVIIHGARRSSGAARGHLPRPIVILVEESEP